MCKIFHNEAIELANIFHKEAGRIIYVTPTNFLDLMSIYQNLLDLRRNQLLDSQTNYETGIERLLQTGIDVERMSE